MSYTSADLRNPDLWDLLAGRLNRGNSSWYDLGDSSHATDIAQIVCTELAHLTSDATPAGGELMECVSSTDKVTAGDALVVLSSSDTTPELADFMRREIMNRLPGLSDVVVLGGVSSVVVADNSATKAVTS